MIAATEPLSPRVPQGAQVPKGPDLPERPKERPAAHRHPGREPLVWLVVGIPLLTIFAGLATLWIAFQRADSNVTEDYYKEGLAINRKIQRDEQARGYRLAGQLTVAADPGAGGATPMLALELALTGSPEAFEPQLTLRMTHPVRQSLDRQLILQGVGAGRYAGQLAAGGLAGTRWMLAVETPGWRLALPGLNGLETGARLAVSAVNADSAAEPANSASSANPDLPHSKP